MCTVSGDPPDQVVKALLAERYGENGWWGRGPVRRGKTAEQPEDTPLEQARRRRALAEEMDRWSERERGVADEDS